MRIPIKLRILEDKVFETKKQKNKNFVNNRGYTLVEILVALAVMGIFFTAILATFKTVLKNSVVSEARVTATGLANQQLEMIHNLPYNSIATTGGWPHGDIPSTQVKILNNINYTINTDVIYIDDPFDSLVPIDTLGSDYKKVKVEVIWDKYESGTPVVLYSDISPRGREEAEQPGGVLSVQVFNNNNDPVSSASIQVNNSSLGLSFSGSTNAEGQRMFYSVNPDSSPNYSIRVTKGGYTSDYTSEITAALPDPDKPHQSIFVGEVTGGSFFIDRVSSLNITTQDDSSPAVLIPNVPLNIIGEKSLGFDGENQPVIRNKFENISTNESSQLALNNIEWDNYTILEEHQDYDIAEISSPDPIILSPNESKNITITLAPHQENTLRVVVVDSDSNPLSQASVRVFNANFDETKETSAAGQVFFSPLDLGSYTLEISKTGYVNYSNSIDILGQILRKVILSLPI